MPARRVVIVGYPGVELLDVAGPVDVFAAAERLLGRGRYRVELAGPSLAAIPTGSGLSIVPHTSLPRLVGSRARVDTLIVAGGLVAAVREARSVPLGVAALAGRARRVASVCTGALVLAQAGLLEGRRVTTHWAACAELRRLHPGCEVLDDAIFVRAGRIWTSAGVTAGIDLALALVEEDHGPSVALEIARWLVMYVRRPGGQRQFSRPLEAQQGELDPLRRLAGWMLENLGEDLSVPRLAERGAMSVRTFARAFRRELGATPAAYVARLRLDAARSALELTSRSPKQIAASVGFGTVEALYRAFRRELGTTPLEYRERFATRGPRRARGRPAVMRRPDF